MAYKLSDSKKFFLWTFQLIYKKKNKILNLLPYVTWTMKGAFR